VEEDDLRAIVAIDAVIERAFFLLAMVHKQSFVLVMKAPESVNVVGRGVEFGL